MSYVLSKKFKLNKCELNELEFVDLLILVKYYIDKKPSVDLYRLNDKFQKLDINNCTGEVVRLRRYLNDLCTSYKRNLEGFIPAFSNIIDYIDYEYNKITNKLF